MPERGASTIELAVAMPALLMLVLGSMMLALAFYQSLVVDMAAAEGARVAAACSATDAVCAQRGENRARAFLRFGVDDPTSYTIAHSTIRDGVRTRDVMTISGTYTVPVPIVGSLDIPLDAAAQRLRERTLLRLGP